MEPCGCLLGLVEREWSRTDRGDSALKIPGHATHISARPRSIFGFRDCFGQLPNGQGPRNDVGGFIPIVTSETEVSGSQ